MSAKQVLDHAQSLYERHKVITYPRSDSRHLPLEQHDMASSVMGAIGKVNTALDKAVKAADAHLKSKAFNDKKVDAHHAIIPTAKAISAGRLSAQELKLYELIARQYLAQFYSDHLYTDTKVTLDIAGGQFRARSRMVRELGWKALLGREKKSGEGDTGDHVSEHLPTLSVGQVLHCIKGECLEKQTQAPKAFTDASLLAAMTGIARFVSDSELRKVLKETDGLGTEATRAGIIELLFKRRFLTRQGKQIRSTEAGRGLIDSLPVQTTRPDMTAQWEATLNAMVSRTAHYKDFMGDLIPGLTTLVEKSSTTLPVALKGVKSAPIKRRKPKAVKKPRAKKLNAK